MATTTLNLERALNTPDLRWPFPDELEWLASHAQGPKRIVEVGSYLGRSTVALAANTEGMVYALDDWYGPRDSDVKDEDRHKFYDEFLANVKGLPVEPIRCDHADTTAFPAEWLRGTDDQKPDMVFIDGDHEYDGVKRDILIWRARLAKRGLLCGHDRNEPGVRKAIDELLPGWKPAPGHSMIWYWTEDTPVAMGLRTMSIAELNLVGTPNALPVNPMVSAGPGPRLQTETPDDWNQLGGDENITSIGMTVMMPSVTRNADGSMRVRPQELTTAMSLLSPLANCRHMVLTVKDMERGAARTALVKKSISYGARWGMFIDDDTVPPPDAMQRLQYVLENADDDVAVCAGIYTTKTDPAVPLVFQDYGVGPYWRWRRGDVFECRAIATGCMMIRLSIFDSLPEPWFVDVHGVEHARSLGLYKDSPYLPLSTEWTDDMFFCHKVREAGFRLMAHGGVLCDHWGQDGRVYRLAADSYPMRHAASSAGGANGNGKA